MNKTRAMSMVCGGVFFAVTASMVASMSGCIVVVDKDDDDYGSLSSDSNGERRIGVEVEKVRSAVGAQAGVMPGTGLVVTRVVPGSPAAAAGMQQYDVIKGVEGQPDGSLASLRAAIKDKNVGDTVNLTVVRGGQEMMVTSGVAVVRD